MERGRFSDWKPPLQNGAPGQSPLRPVTAAFLCSLNRPSSFHGRVWAPPLPSVWNAPLPNIHGKTTSSPAEARPGTEWMLEQYLLDRQVGGWTKGRDVRRGWRAWRKLCLCRWVGSGGYGKHGAILSPLGDHRGWRWCLLLTHLREGRAAASGKSCTSDKEPGGTSTVAQTVPGTRMEI